MESFAVKAIVAVIGALAGWLIQRLDRAWTDRQRRKRAPKGSLALGQLVLPSLNLSGRARRLIERSQFIQSGKTGEALMSLMSLGRGQSAAPRSRGLKAICGYKGDFSLDYYRRNFEFFRSVKRVFSFEAMVDEMNDQRHAYALAGLKMHLDQLTNRDCAVEVVLITKGHRIKDIDAARMNPASSFGLAIVTDDANRPFEAVAHWEISAKFVRDLLSIEGVSVDAHQRELLDELVSLHEAICSSNFVISSKASGGVLKLEAAVKELEATAAAHGIPVPYP